MASTSSFIGNASQPLLGCGMYDVFINHRGPDVKNSLASTIYHTLDLIGVRAFLDREELRAGEEISDAIKEAIWSARVHIAIFSSNYGQSSWCLDELTLMLQTGKKIIPIFYHVAPSDLRWLRGVYSEAFAKHEENRRYPPEKLKKWKEALSTVSKISGLEFNERQTDEGLLLKQIVNNVRTEMRNIDLLDVGRHSVGLDIAIENFENFVKNDCSQSKQNIKVVWVVGMGGCGKTTLVKEYFNKKRSSYQSSSFLFDVKDAAANKTLHDLQKKLLEDLVHLGSVTFRHTSEGKRVLEDRVRSVKALIILDDVDHPEQMDALLPLKGNLGADSLIVVTTRDKGLIEASAFLSPSVSPYVYKIGGLDPVYAKQLFCWHAFLRDSPAKGFEDLVEKFSNACQGLPLSLKVLGAQLSGKNSRDYWESLLHKISQILPEDIKQVLKVSYDSLDEEQKQMFLDIACFFIGEQKNMAISIWDGSSSDDILWSGWHGFHILENKCLVEVDHDKRIGMHDHLRDLGREIAIKKTPSRFWSLLQFQRPLEERLPIRGIMAATGWAGYCNLHYEPPFEECMQLLMGHSTSRSRRLTPSALGLQLLVVSGDYLKEEFAKVSEELVWLRWYDFPHEKLPSWLSRGKLRVLELYRSKRLKELWGPNDAPPLLLRELIIHTDYQFQIIAETIGVLKYLKKIVLKGDYFKNKIATSSLPEEFCLLESLEHLELSNFLHLSSLPTDFGKLRKLKYVDLTGCRSLTALPVSFKQLTELQHLDLSRCENLQIEKDNLENITKLEKLRLGGCSKLQQLPSETTRQMYLRELCLNWTQLRELPADIDRLAKLEVLEIGSHCLTSLPTSLGNLPSLIKLKIAHCSELKCLPSLANLSCLIKLKIDSCRNLTHLPPVGCLTCLETLDLKDSGVECLPEGFAQLVSLQSLSIWSLPIRELPLANPEECCSKKPRLLNHVDSSMFKFPRLKSIDMQGTKVSAISISQDCCPSLENLYLSQNDDLVEIETLPTTLKRVVISLCEKLVNIRGVAGVAELQELAIACCPGLDELPSFAGVAELQSLKISDCPIRELPSFAGIAKLQKLEICHCPITELPLANPEERFSKKPRLLTHVNSSMIKPEMLPSLKSILLQGTKGSTISISEDCCPSLENLSLWANHDLREIETLPTTLKNVGIYMCEKLENIKVVAGVAGLQSLEILKCPELDELPSFGCCTCLEVLKIDVSRRVTKIEGLEELRSLTRLQIRAERRSAIERCIPPNIVKRGRGMEIVGMAVEDVESVLGSLSFSNLIVVDTLVEHVEPDIRSSSSLSFPNFTVVDTLHKENLYCHMESPLSNASCVIVCFVISPQKWARIRYEVGTTSDGANAPFLPLLGGEKEGKQVYIGVWPKGIHIIDFVEGTGRVLFSLYNSRPEDIVKGMAVIIRKGEEEKTLETLYKFLELLQR